MKQFFKMNKERWLLALVALSFLNASCSTPPVPDNSSDTAYQSAMSSYEVCSQRLYPTSGNNYCNTVSSRYGGMSYNQYVYGNSYGSGYKASGKAELASVDSSEAFSEVSSELLNEAWKSYLQSLDAETLKDMAAQWQQLAN